MPGDGLFTSTLLHLFDALVKLLEQFLEVARVLLKCGAVAIYVSFDDTHVCMFLSVTSGGRIAGRPQGSSPSVGAGAGVIRGGGLFWPPPRPTTAASPRRSTITPLPASERRPA